MAPTAGSTSSTDAAGPRDVKSGRSRRVVLGRISGAHGLRGQLRVRFFGDAPDNLLAAPRVFLAPDEEAPSRGFDVTAASPGRSGEVRLALAGVRKREDAEALARQLVLVDADTLPELERDEVYHFQLDGCRVETTDGRVVGRVRTVWSTGAPDLLIVVDDAGAEHLIPLAEGIVREVDVEARRVLIESIPGLLEPE